MAVNPQSTGILQVVGSEPWLDVACVPIPALETDLLDDRQTHNLKRTYHHILELLICTMPKEGAVVHAELTSAAVGFLSCPVYPENDGDYVLDNIVNVLAEGLQWNTACVACTSNCPETSTSGPQVEHRHSDCRCPPVQRRLSVNLIVKSEVY